MPHFLEGYFWNISNPELWVGIGLVLFFAILVMAGVPKLIAGVLDAKADKIQSELDEAARLRAEAEALLAQIKLEKAEAEAQAADMLKAAEADARRLEADAKVKLEEALARRQTLAERRIAQAEAEEVRADRAERTAYTDIEAEERERLQKLTADPHE